jgi:hypothetical protein
MRSFSAAVPAAIPEVVVPDAPPAESKGGDSGVVTTDAERAVFDHVRTRLAFLLAGDEDGFTRLVHLYPVDYKTVFSVCYKQERKGKLFNFWEGSSPRYRFEFPGGDTVTTDNLMDIDQPLLTAYRSRVSELG